jgi:D-3-phosphoglycerate dehydrogenase / 2-oxoglutarate reductase
VPETVDSLVLDLLAWMGSEARPYGEVMDAWRTSCPRLPVWEEATELGFVKRSKGSMVEVSAAGAAHLATHRA